MNWSEYFIVDNTSGSLIWKERPLASFASPKAYKAWNTKYAGRIAGRTGEYCSVSLGNKKYQAHCIVWEMHKGPVPDGMVLDHIDRNKVCNRIENLRLATKAQNMMNGGVASNNTSGIRGVYFHKASGKWEALIRVNGKRIRLGLWPTMTEAGVAYCTAAKEHFGEFARFD